MKRKRCSDEQIAFALRQESGTLMDGRVWIYRRSLFPRLKRGYGNPSMFTVTSRHSPHT